MSEPASSLAVVPRAATSITQRARGAFTDEQIELIKRTVCKDATNSELYMFLELCARYELDPFAREIWAVKLKANDPDAPVTIMMARDGLLKLAQRSGEFEGIEGDVVHEKDEFRKEAGKELPTHTYQATSRGAIVGAWCTCYRSNRKPTFFFAPFEEYCPDKGSPKYKYSPWSSQTSAMILKCAEAMALRKAFSITGVVGEEEMARAESQARLLNGSKDPSAVGPTDAIEWGDDPTLVAWLKALVEAVNEVRPGAYLPAKLAMQLAGRTDAEREEWAQLLVADLEARKLPVPVREQPEVIHDAEVVDEHDEPPADYLPGSDQDEDEIPFGPSDEAIDGQTQLDA